MRMCECLFSLEIQTAGWISTKFGTKVVLEGEGSWLGFKPVPPTLQVQGPKWVSGLPLEPQHF